MFIYGKFLRECGGLLMCRAGSGHFFYGAGRVLGLGFWPGSGSGQDFLATGQFGPPILANF